MIPTLKLQFNMCLIVIRNIIILNKLNINTVIRVFLNENAQLRTNSETEISTCQVRNVVLLQILYIVNVISTVYSKCRIKPNTFHI